MNVTVFFSDLTQRQYAIGANTVGDLRNWIVADAGAQLHGRDSWMITVADYLNGAPNWAPLPDAQQLNNNDLFYAYYGSA